MDLHGEFQVSCDVCDQLVSAADVQLRRNIRSCLYRDRSVLVCPQCAWTVDHIRPRIGLRYGS